MYRSLVVTFMGRYSRNHPPVGKQWGRRGRFPSKFRALLRLNHRRSRISPIRVKALFYRGFCILHEKGPFWPNRVKALFYRHFCHFPSAPLFAKITREIDPISTRPGIIRLFILPLDPTGISRACLSSEISPADPTPPLAVMVSRSRAWSSLSRDSNLCGGGWSSIPQVVHQEVTSLVVHSTFSIVIHVPEPGHQK